MDKSDQRLQLYDKVLQLVDEMLILALKYGKFKDFLFGSSFYKLTEKDSYGNDIYSARKVMEAIYKKHKIEPELGLNKKSYNTILDTLSESKYEPCLKNVIENIEYHINAEKNGTATFQMNNEKLLDSLREHIKININNYRNSSQQFGPYGLYPT